jgi:hypothetical protein
MHEFNRGLMRGINNLDDNNMPRSEIRKKIIFMLSTVKDLMIDGLITDFSILESSLEQVFKNVVTMHAETNIRHARRNMSEGLGES